jgi:hypothetical protein
MTPKAALDTHPQRDPQREKWELIKFTISLSVGIFVVLGFGFFHKGLHGPIAGICKIMLLSPPEDMKAWDYWEIGALIWSAFTAFVFYAFTPQIMNILVDRFFVGVLSLGQFVFHYLAAFTLFERDHGGHIFWLLMIGVGFGVIDLLNVLYQKDLREKNEAMQSLLFADVPMIIAFVIFMFFASKHGHDGNTDIFLSGAISFQFVASTFIFAFIQGGIPDRVEKCLEKMSA